MEPEKKRIWRGLQYGLSRCFKMSPAAVLLGTTINILDAVSMGLLLFPSAKDGTIFQGLQSQAVSLFLMSTITSQLVLTLGGSSFPGALGSMLLEAVPFLRGIALAIRDRLGENHPGVLPTTMAAYAATSLLLGAVFTLLGCLNCGRLAGYLPQTVLTGAIGALGVSLCVLGLEITLPESSAPLRFSTAGGVIFNREHLPLLGASLAPTLFLSMSMRTEMLEKYTKGFTKHPLYVPIFSLSVAAVFWIAIASSDNVTSEVLARLASNGWLFGLEKLTNHAPSLTDWSYWALFDFSHVQWRAIPAAAESIVLLVVIGAISLPVFVPATALALNEPSYDMNHEFLGHGISNLLAGAVGTVPNLVVFSNSKFFGIAGGGRPEATVVSLFTLAFFFVSSSLLPYVPTVLASTLVLFFGIELLIDALWESSKSLVLREWATVLGTVVACTALGFAPGIALGVGIVILLQFWHSIINSRPRIVQPCTMQHSEVLQDARGSSSYILSRIHAIARSTSSGSNNDAIIRRESSAQAQPTIIYLTGHLGFATIPQIDRVMSEIRTSMDDVAYSFVVLDFCAATYIDTSLVQFLERKTRELKQQPLPRLAIITGAARDSIVHADLIRGGLDCCWDDRILGSVSTSRHKCIKAHCKAMACEKLITALQFCQSMIRGHYGNIRDRDVHYALDKIFLDSTENILSHLPSRDSLLLERLAQIGVHIRIAATEETLACGEYTPHPVFLVLKGRVVVKELHTGRGSAPKSRRSAHKDFRAFPRLAIQRLVELWHQSTHGGRTPGENLEGVDASLRYFSAGNIFGLIGKSSGAESCVYATEGPCWILDVNPANSRGLAWVMHLAAVLRERSKSSDIEI